MPGIVVFMEILCLGKTQATVGNCQHCLTLHRGKLLVMLGIYANGQMPLSFFIVFINGQTYPTHDIRMNLFSSLFLKIIFKKIQNLLYKLCWIHTYHKTFFFMDKFGRNISTIFKMLKHHFRMIFRFSAACLSSVVFASSLNVTSKCQCILSTLQCPLTARLNNSTSSFRLLI